MTPNLFNSYRYATGGGAPIQTDMTEAIWATGYPSYINDCQTWTDDSWSTEANEGSLAQAAGGGTASNFVRCCGNDNSSRHSDVSSFNGTSWTSEASMSNTWYELAGDGTRTDFIQVCAAGGTCGTFTRCAECHTYNGTSWTQINNYPVADNGIATGGNADYNLCVGGETDGKDLTASYNGSVWATETALGYDTSSGCCSGTGTLNTYYCGYAGGNTQRNCNSFAGGTWTAEANASYYSRLSARGGSGNSGVMRIAGRGGTGSGDYSYLDQTEVFQTSLTWTSKANISSAVYQLVGGGA